MKTKIETKVTPKKKAKKGSLAAAPVAPHEIVPSRKAVRKTKARAGGYIIGDGERLLLLGVARLNQAFDDAQLEELGIVRVDRRPERVEVPDPGSEFDAVKLAHTAIHFTSREARVAFMDVEIAAPGDEGRYLIAGDTVLWDDDGRDDG